MIGARSELQTLTGSAKTKHMTITLTYPDAATASDVLARMRAQRFAAMPAEFATPLAVTPAHVQGRDLVIDVDVTSQVWTKIDTTKAATQLLALLQRPAPVAAP